MHSLFFFSIVPIMLEGVMAVNVILFITYWVVRKQFELKGLIISLILFFTEVVLFAFMLISPFPDGGVFFQAFIIEIVGIMAIVAQSITILKLRKRTYK